MNINYKPAFTVVLLVSIFVAALVTTLASGLAHAANSEPITVRVSASHFPPYINESPNGRSGMAIDMLNIINDFQSKYHFTVVASPTMRRFYFFEQGRYNVSFFDHLHWGWENYAVKATNVYLRGGEKYVALAKPGRGQEYFEGFKGKTLGGFLGYHYGVAKFNSDPKVLKQEYNMELSSTHEGNLRKVLGNRIDVAILTDAFLSRYFVLHPEQKAKLLVSDIWDQRYNFSIIVRDDSTPNVEELNQLLLQMKRVNALQPLWEKYGIPSDFY